MAYTEPLKLFWTAYEDLRERVLDPQVAGHQRTAAAERLADAVLALYLAGTDDLRRQLLVVKLTEAGLPHAERLASAIDGRCTFREPEFSVLEDEGGPPDPGDGADTTGRWEKLCRNLLASDRRVPRSEDDWEDAVWAFEEGNRRRAAVFSTDGEATWERWEELRESLVPTLNAIAAAVRWSQASQLVSLQPFDALASELLPGLRNWRARRRFEKGVEAAMEVWVQHCIHVGVQPSALLRGMETLGQRERVVTTGMHEAFRTEAGNPVFELEQRALDEQEIRDGLLCELQSAMTATPAGSANVKFGTGGESMFFDRAVSSSLPSPSGPGPGRWRAAAEECIRRTLRTEAGSTPPLEVLAAAAFLHEAWSANEGESDREHGAWKQLRPLSGTPREQARAALARVEAARESWSLPGLEAAIRGFCWSFHVAASEAAGEPGSPAAFLWNGAQRMRALMEAWSRGDALPADSPLGAWARRVAARAGPWPGELATLVRCAGDDAPGLAATLGIETESVTEWLSELESRGVEILDSEGPPLATDSDTLPSMRPRPPDPFSLENELERFAGVVLGLPQEVAT